MYFIQDLKGFLIPNADEKYFLFHSVKHDLGSYAFSGSYSFSHLI